MQRYHIVFNIIDLKGGVRGEKRDDQICLTMSPSTLPLCSSLPPSLFGKSAPQVADGQAVRSPEIQDTRSCFALCLWPPFTTFLMLRPVPSSFAQKATAGTLLGRVTDPSGTAVPNVTVIVRQEQTGYVRKGQTNAEGEYVLISLPVGTYT